MVGTSATPAVPVEKGPAKPGTSSVSSESAMEITWLVVMRKELGGEAVGKGGGGLEKKEKYIRKQGYIRKRFAWLSESESRGAPVWRTVAKWQGGGPSG